MATKAKRKAIKQSEEGMAKAILDNANGQGPHKAHSNTEEQTIIAQDAAITEMKQGIWQLNYYIPAVLSDEVPNPAGRFHRAGIIAEDGSYWLLSASRVEHPTITEELKFWDSWAPGSPNIERWNEQRMRDGLKPLVGMRAGVRYRLVPVHPEYVEAMREWAWECLAERVREIHASLIERIGNAAERLDKAREAQTADLLKSGQILTITQEDLRLERARHQAVRAAIKDATQAIEGAIEAAECFDAEEKFPDLFRAVFNAIRAETQAHNARVIAEGDALQV